VIEGHIRFHVLDPKRDPTDEQAQAADDLIHASRVYLKWARVTWRLGPPTSQMWKVQEAG
jgi:hypothetical protein